MLHICAECSPIRPLFSGLSKASGRAPIEHERAAVKRARSKMRKAVAEYLADKAPGVAAQLADLLSLSQKRSPARDKALQALVDLDIDWTDLPGEVEQYLAGVAVSGGGLSLDQLNIGDGEEADLMRLRAEAWARNRSAEMVGMKWVDGELVPNPNAVWRIDDATRDMLRGSVEAAIDEGWSPQKLADQIKADHAFSDVRADTIARTEIARADSEGSVIGWEASGLVEGREWLTAEGCCDACQELDGVIVGLREPFPGGIDGTPAHPNCRCAQIPVLSSK